KNARNLIKEIVLEGLKAVRTPMKVYEKLNSYVRRFSTDFSNHRCMIDNLFFLATSRLELCYSVGVYTNYQSNLVEFQLKAFKHIIRYINDNLDLGIWLLRDTNMSLAGFSDAN
ncbi:hypothetical protein J1N35_006167, partial [Gossypium stocksii]